MKLVIAEWQPSLRKTAESHGIDIEEIKNLDLSENDVFISLEYDKIINPSALNGASCFNIHFSNLPKYRGCLTSVWPIREGQKIAGVTLHVLSQGIDDGPIVDQFSSKYQIILVPMTFIYTTTSVLLNFSRRIYGIS